MTFHTVTIQIGTIDDPSIVRDRTLNGENQQQGDNKSSRFALRERERCLGFGSRAEEEKSQTVSLFSILMR